MFDHVFLIVPAQFYVSEFLKTFVDYPPRQKAASFSLERVMETLEHAASGAG
jgi:arylsulfatase